MGITNELLLFNKKLVQLVLSWITVFGLLQKWIRVRVLALYI